MSPRYEGKPTPATQGYVWNTIPQVPQLLMDATSAYIYDGGLAPAEQVNLATGTITYLITDSLGSVRGTVNSAGTLTGTCSYDAWGNPVTAGGLTATTPFGYAGGYTDPTGLIYLLNRYYQPSTGQFISVDPAITKTLQPYAYADGNPVSNTDPSGLCVRYYGWVDYKFCFSYATQHQTVLFIDRLGLIADGALGAATILGLLGAINPGAIVFAIFEAIVWTGINTFKDYVRTTDDEGGGHGVTFVNSYWLLSWWFFGTHHRWIWSGFWLEPGRVNW